MTRIYFALLISLSTCTGVTLGEEDGPVRFTVQSARSGDWSNPQTWDPPRVPGKGDLVLIRGGTRVVYDVESEEVLRLVQVVGTLTFARDRDTLLNVGIVKVQNSTVCSEAGFACDFHNVNAFGEPKAAPGGPIPALEIGTPQDPIPRQYQARVRLHYHPGTNKNDAPAIACCSARMDIHGAPLNRTWVDLAENAEAGSSTVKVAGDLAGWQVGDQIIVTGSEHNYGADDPQTEQRRITKIEGQALTLDRPLQYAHLGSDHRRSEVANLSRSVVIESADPEGVRGHTVYHQYSQGSISYARFAHLGKRNVLGRYAIHFHLVGTTMRGSRVEGVAIVDSHNRWITVHGTDYLVVRDCVGYRSVGHGFFLEDGTEVYTLIDRNLGVQATAGERLPKQVMPFDPNDGAAFWWANGRNTLIRNVACENERYGYRYDSQNRSNFDSRLFVRMPDGELERVDIRTLPIFRFENNETHTEGLYGVAVAGTDGIGPDTRHPHVIGDLNIWEVHYALRTQLPTMLVENVTIDGAAYGIYRPEFNNHVYRNLVIANTSAEPFNRGQDDRSVQSGTIAVDGITFANFRHGGVPLIQLSDNNLSGKAESHFRNVKIADREDGERRALVDRGGGPRPTPETPTSVPVFLHDYFGPGRHAKIVSTAARDFGSSQEKFRKQPPITGSESAVAEVHDVEFPQLLDPVDDLPPATVILSPARGHTAKLDGDILVVRGTTTDNGRTRKVIVNGVPAKDVDYNFHRWEARLTGIQPGKLEIVARAEDESGNVEQTPHKLTVVVEAQ